MTLAWHLALVMQCDRSQRWIIYLISYVNILAVHVILPHSQINYCKETKPWTLSAQSLKILWHMSYSDDRTDAVETA